VPLLEQMAVGRVVVAIWAECVTVPFGVTLVDATVEEVVSTWRVVVVAHTSHTGPLFSQQSPKAMQSLSHWHTPA
jgi:hypothetical protein